jgi:hypothetical protein
VSHTHAATACMWLPCAYLQGSFCWLEPWAWEALCDRHSAVCLWKVMSLFSGKHSFLIPFSMEGSSVSVAFGGGGGGGGFLYVLWNLYAFLEGCLLLPAFHGLASIGVCYCQHAPDRLPLCCFLLLYTWALLVLGGRRCLPVCMPTWNSCFLEWR